MRKKDCSCTGISLSHMHARHFCWRAFGPPGRQHGAPADAEGWLAGASTMLLLTPPMAALLLMPGSSLQRASPHPRLRSVSRCCSRARVPLLSEESDAQMAAQAVAWFDEVSMLQVFYMGDLRHDAGAADADAIEAAIVASGGNVSRYLTPEERTLPRGGEAALAALEVGFSIGISDSDSDAPMPPREVRLRVRFTQGYPLQGARPRFELLHDMPSSELPQVG